MLKKMKRLSMYYFKSSFEKVHTLNVIDYVKKTTHYQNKILSSQYL